MTVDGGLTGRWDGIRKSTEYPFGCRLLVVYRSVCCFLAGFTRVRTVSQIIFGSEAEPDFQSILCVHSELWHHGFLRWLSTSVQRCLALRSAELVSVL